jgi:hypothetical protein
MSAAAAVWAALAASAALPLQPAHAPVFSLSLENLTLVGASAPYTLPVHVVRDTGSGAPQPRGVVVAAWTERTSFLVQTGGGGLGEFSLLAPSPALAPRELPALPRYGWAWLWGAKATTVTWLDCCGVTGDESGWTIAAAPDGASVALRQWQRWLPNGSHAGRDAYSEHNFTLAWDRVYGYTVEAVTRLRINAAAAPAAAEFVNFLPPRLASPWPPGLAPGGWPAPPAGAPLPPGAGPWPLPHATATLWANDSAATAFTGFGDNLLAGAELGTYALARAATAGVVLVAARGAHAPGLAYGLSPGDGNASFLQQTCPTWMDQHQLLRLPPAGADGFVDVAPAWSLRWAPPAAADWALARATLLHSADAPPANPPPRWFASNMLRVGAVETFEAQPVPLTAPLRALVTAKYAADYDVVAQPGVGLNGSGAAWRVAARAEAAASADSYAFANQQPLIPLNASTGVRVLGVAKAAAQRISRAAVGGPVGSRRL